MVPFDSARMSVGDGGAGATASKLSRNPFHSGKCSLRTTGNSGGKLTEYLLPPYFDVVLRP